MITVQAEDKPAESFCPEVSARGDQLSRLAQSGRLHLYHTVTSTNNIARQLAASSEPAVVIADTQTQGRGRFSRHWHSPVGSLYLSFPHFSKGSCSCPSSLVPLIAGLACAYAIEQASGLKPEILWPNDILIDGLKVAGVLCETSHKAVVVGIGININQETFPKELTNAASLRMLTGITFDRFELAEILLREFQRFADVPSEALAEIRSRMTWGRPVTVETGWTKPVPLTLAHIHGTAVDLTPQGELVLRLDSGSLKTLSAGKVVRLR